MKKVLFGIVLILFAIFLILADMPGLLGADQFILLVVVAGLVCAGIGAFTEDE